MGLCSAIQKIHYNFQWWFDPNQEEQVAIFPNPTFGEFQISGLAGSYTVDILDRSGATLKSFISESGMIDIHDLPSGLYFVKTVSEDRSKVFVNKVLKI